MSDVKKIDVTNAINSMNEAVTAFKGAGYVASNKNASTGEIETLEIESKIEEEKDEGIIEGFFNDIKDGIKDIGEVVTDKVDSVLGKYEWYQDFTDFVDENVIPIASRVADAYMRTQATAANLGFSLVEGVVNLAEIIVDMNVIVGSVFVTFPALVVDGCQAIYGAVTDNEWESLTKKVWGFTKGFVAKDFSSGLFDLFYENTYIGNFIKEKSFGFDVVRGIGNGISEIVAVVAISLASGGTLAPFAIAAYFGFGKGAEKAWGEGAGIGKGLLYATGNSLWEGLQFYVGGKIGGSTIFGEGGKLLTSLGSKASKLLNSASRIILDGFDGGAEGFVQPLLASVYKDGYYDDEGNYVEFKDSDNILDKYGEIFDDYGSWKNVFTNAVVGSGASFLGEAFDIGRFFNKNTGSEITAKLTDPDATVTLKLGEEITSKLSSTNKDINSVKNLYEGGDYKEYKNYYQGKIAQYFNDPRQYIFSKLDDIAIANPNNTELIKSINDVKNTPIREIDTDEIYKNYSKYLSKEDKKTLKELIKQDKLYNNYTDIEQDVLEAYSQTSGPAITAYNRKTITNFKGVELDGRNFKSISDWIGISFGKIGKYSKLSKLLDVDKFVDVMDNIINKSVPLKEDLIVYRSANSVFKNGERVNTFDIGTRFDDQAFVSTSVIPTSISQRNDIVMEIQIPKGTKALYLEKFTGVKNYGQQELLLGRNHEFEIISLPKHGKDGKTYLKVRLVPQNNSIVKTLSLDKINTNNVASNYYDNFIRKGTDFDNKQIDINDVMLAFKEKGLLGKYEAEVRDLYNKNLYQIDIPEHNVDHVERVLFYSMYMGEELGLEPWQMNILIEAAKYHDSGRINLQTDTNHAELSAMKLIDDLEGKYDSEDLDIMAAVIEYHEAGDSLDDINRIFNKYDISPTDVNDVYKIATILKDADALDRVRFPNNLKTEYLRNDLASQLVKSSYQIQELRAHENLSNDFLNNKYSPKEMDNIVALKESGVPDYLIYFYNRYKTKPVYDMIMKILGYNIQK